MQKSGLIIVILGLLIVTGLVVSIVGNQVTLEGINQGNGEVSSTQTVTISVDFDMEKTPIGIFAVQVMEFKENTISIKILDPSDIEIIFQEVNEDTIEEKFDVLETGTYQLVIQSSNDEGIYVTGAIGPLPDANKKNIISIISTSTLLIGMIGLVVIGIYGIKNRKRSV
ncbi:MAG: hypothetical protein OEQ15_03760 [Nitrosopumilus sp.]|nr:hypothetical protein [Nitrosopumilus sp.]MDH3793594.1 hypothetical protein [Nitrosopumilus sp.]